jgi:hypothetical protein
MGEAKRRWQREHTYRRDPNARPWAMGCIDVLANGKPCFS